MLHSRNVPIAFAYSVSDTLVGEILSFLALKVGWCYGRGGPADINAVLSVLQILRLVRELGYDRIEAFPEPAGGVLLSAFHGDDSVEVLCRHGGAKFDFVVERQSTEIELDEDVDQELVLKGLWELSCAAQPKSSAFCTLDSTANTNVDSRALLSKIPMTDFPSSTVYAQSAQAVHFAPISDGFTPQRQAILQYTGGLQSGTSLTAQDSSWINPILGTNAITWSSGTKTNFIVSGSNDPNWATMKSVPMAG